MTVAVVRMQHHSKSAFSMSDPGRTMPVAVVCRYRSPKFRDHGQNDRAGPLDLERVCKKECTAETIIGLMFKSPRKLIVIMERITLNYNNLQYVQEK